MAMRNLIVIFFFLFIGCSNDNKNNAANKSMTDSLTDKQIVISDSNKIASDRFFVFLNKLDSHGYCSDSNKYKYSYGLHNPRDAKYSLYKDFIIFKVLNYKNAPCFSYFANDSSSKKDRLSIRNYKRDFSTSKYSYLVIDSTKFCNVKNIVGCPFIMKKSTDGSNYPDGVFEEWTFPDSISANKASDELCDKAGGQRLYFYFGAYICCVKNYMYVMYSRSAFYTDCYIKSFFKDFTKDNKATMHNLCLL